MAIFDQKTKSHYSNYTLTTGSSVASINENLDASSYDEALFFIEWTNAASGANSDLSFFIEFSEDGTTWFRETSESVSSGTSTISEKVREYAQVAADAGTDRFVVSIPVTTKFLRADFSETVGSGSAGTLNVDVIFSVLNA